MSRPFAHPVACCCRVVAQSLKLIKLLSQQLKTFLLFRDRRSVAQQVWIRLHRSSNIVGATHAIYTWSPKSYGLYPSREALQVPTLLKVVASFCTSLVMVIIYWPMGSRKLTIFTLSIIHFVESGIEAFGFYVQVAKLLCQVGTHAAQIARALLVRFWLTLCQVLSSRERQ